jgi:hypothetical protein
LSTPAILWGSLGPDSHSPDPALPTQSLVHLATPWADATGYRPFPTAMLQAAWANGQVTLLDWISWNLSNRADPTFALTAVGSGVHDVYLHQWARDAALWKHPFLLRFDPEFNLPQDPKVRLYGGQPALFVQAWQHVHDLFVAEGATNVTWVWCPNVIPPTNDLLTAYYPGDGYVDWTAVDSYVKQATPWMSLEQILNGYPGWNGATYDTLLKIAPSKPMLIGEFNVIPDPRRPDWFIRSLAVLPVLFPAIRALSLYNTSGSAQWALEPAALAAFKLGVSAPAYLPAGVWTPADLQPLPAPPYEATALPVVPVQLAARTWFDVARDLETDLALANAAANAAATIGARLLEDANTQHDTDTASMLALSQTADAVRAACRTLVDLANQP